jgi:hypothetical protein
MQCAGIHLFDLLLAAAAAGVQGIVYVVDSCYVKQRAYNPLVGLESLLVAPTSKASCQQRAGRAGRVRPGHAFRLCTEEDYQELLPDASVPEMQRSDLSSLLLQLKVRLFVQQEGAKRRGVDVRGGWDGRQGDAVLRSGVTAAQQNEKKLK